MRQSQPHNETCMSCSMLLRSRTAWGYVLLLNLLVLALMLLSLFCESRKLEKAVSWVGGVL